MDAELQDFVVTYSMIVRVSRTEMEEVVDFTGSIPGPLTNN